MRAAVYDRYGGPEVVTVQDVPRPAPTDGQLLVRVRSGTVNRTDCGYRAASPPVIRLLHGLRRPKRQVLGCEFAGVVTEVGAAVVGFSVGDRVFGYLEGAFGGHGEYLVVDEDASIALVPDGIGFDQAAAATEGSHYALACLDRAGVGAGTDLLVHGATGAIGSAAVQLAKVRGAVVTAVGAAPHLDLIAGLGADRVVDHTTGDFTADDQRYDAVVDAVGKSTFGACRGLLRPRGVYVSTELGPRGQNLRLAVTTRFGRGQRVRFPFPHDDQAMVRHLAELLASGAFRPLIDRTYALEEVVAAYEYVESGQKLGSVILAISEL